jgi:putative DNA primase/helicase
MNELPKDTEQTKAFFRRFLIVPFEVRIPDDEQDPDLARTIIDNEMSGVLNFVVRGVKSLLATGRFDIPSIVQKENEKFQRESDTVLTFQEESRLRPSSEHWKTLREMFDAYKAHCLDEGSRAVSKRAFAKRLRDLGFETGKHGRKKTTIVYAEQEDDAE